jgi:hypothetical protein
LTTTHADGVSSFLGEILMHSSPASGNANEPGGEGGSFLRDLFAAPTQITDALSSRGLLAVSLLLGALLVSLAATALAP